ncbi:MAG: Single-stranded DNA binding protein [Methanocellales archaeon]
MEDISPHLEEIKRALVNVDEAKILADLKILLFEYNVPVEEAKRTIIKKYGGFAKQVIAKKLKDLTPEDKNVEVIVKILDIGSKNLKIGTEEKTIFFGLIGDETKVMRFTAWRDFSLRKGDVVKITNAYVREFKGSMELNFGERAKIEIMPDILPNLSPVSGVKKLAEIREGDRNISVIGKILEAKQQEISIKQNKKIIITGIIADETSKLPFTSWVSEAEIVKDATLKLENVYVKKFQGLPAININEATIITRVPDLDIDINISKEIIRLGEVVGKEGAFDVTVEGDILSIRPGSGLIQRCPSCHRVIQKNICRSHGKVQGIYDMRIKATLDDGTGAIMIVLNREETEKLYGQSLEKCKEIAMSALSTEVIEEDIKRKFTGRRLVVRGNASRTDYGIMLVAREAWMPSFNIEEKARALLEVIKHG